MAVQQSFLLALLVGAVLAVTVAGQCKDSSCGPNAKCATSSGLRCICDEGFYGRPPWKHCRPENDPECLDDAGCPDNLACRARLCESPCSRTCSPDLRCTVKNHKAQCGPGIYPTISSLVS